jgi:hypothetical protein
LYEFEVYGELVDGTSLISGQREMSKLIVYPNPAKNLIFLDNFEDSGCRFKFGIVPKLW